MNVLIHNARIVKPGAGISNGSVLVRDGHIVAVGEVDTATSDEVPVVDGGGRLLTQGLIDLHTHGVDTALYERSEEDYFAAASVLPKFGNTCVLPTLYRVMNRPSLKLLERFADTLPKVKEVSMPGFHLEGPFLALPGAGADTIPGDVVLLEELIAACRGRVLAMSISPYTKNIIPVIERLVAHKITPLMTHTAATAEQTQAAIDAGASHATHFYDVFPAPEVTEPGVRPVGTVEAILADPRVTVDFVCDCVHASPFAIRAALAAKGWQASCSSRTQISVPDSYPVFTTHPGDSRCACVMATAHATTRRTHLPAVHSPWTAASSISSTGSRFLLSKCGQWEHSILHASSASNARAA